MNASHIQALLKANDLRNQGQYAQAIEVYQQLQQTNNDSVLLSALAHSFFSMALTDFDETGENFQQAVDVMQRAISLAPKDGYLHAALASFYALGLNDYISAVAHYRQAVELHPHVPRILFEAASLYGLPDKLVTLDEAIDLVARAVALEPYNSVYLARLAELYTQAGSAKEAIQAWHRALLCPTPYTGATETAQRLEQ